MKKLHAGIALAALTATLGVAPVAAHHSFAMFDDFEVLVEEATVVDWQFNNPHSWLYVKIANEDGVEEDWAFEAAAPVATLRRTPSTSGTTFEPGDKIKFIHCPLRDGRNGGHLGWVQTADGTIYNPADGGCNGNEENQARWARWMENGISSSVDGEAFDAANPPAEAAAAAQ